MSGRLQTARRLRILVVAVNYAPEPGGTAPYTTDASEHLASLGHTVEILTGMPHYPSWKVAQEYAGRFRVREWRRGVRLRRLRHYVPSSQSAAKRAIYETSFALHALISPRMSTPDVVVAVVPSLFGALAARVIAWRERARLVVWMQDSVSRGAAQTGIRGGAALSTLLAALEGWVLRSSDDVIVISDGFRSQVESAGVSPARVSLIRNWTHISPPTIARAEMRRRMGWADDELIALHAGNMGLKQGLENMVDAGRLSFEQKSNVRFVLMGDGNQRAQLQARAGGIPTVSFVPPVGDAEYSSLLAAADVLVVNEREGVRDMSLPSKLTSYAVAGRPVVAAVAAGGGTAQEMRRLRLGDVIDSGSPQSLLRQLPRLLNERATDLPANPAVRDSAKDSISAGAARDQIARVVEGRGAADA